MTTSARRSALSDGNPSPWQTAAVTPVRDYVQATGLGFRLGFWLQIWVTVGVSIPCNVICHVDCTVIDNAVANLPRSVIHTAPLAT